MSILWNERRRRASVTAALSMVLAFQTLVTVRPVDAGVPSHCTYDGATDTVDIFVALGGLVEVAVETASADLHPTAPPGAIIAAVGSGGIQPCGDATNSNTGTIDVTGEAGIEEFRINERVGRPFNGDIDWSIDLGQGGDLVRISGSDRVDDEIALTDTTFDLNGNVGQLAGIEEIAVSGGRGDDRIDGSDLTNTLLVSASGGRGGDGIMPGPQATLPPALGPLEHHDGGPGIDQLTYFRNSRVVIDLTLGHAGLDANDDCDVMDPGDERDIIENFEVFQTGPGDDCLIGGAENEAFFSSDGNDVVVGGAGSDLVLGGSGNDLIDGGGGGDALRGFGGDDLLAGRAGDDVLIGGAGTDQGNGGPGKDVCNGVESTVSCGTAQDPQSPHQTGRRPTERATSFV